ncbi:MAG: hypothetical protein GDA50_08130, partial [Alphaproteobacteria bacterium GM202ARS2]|nr:hypothetical protein [Alphaproteobacteria bacterium GM202ARS2]
MADDNKTPPSPPQAPQQPPQKDEKASEAAPGGASEGDSMSTLDALRRTMGETETPDNKDAQASDTSTETPETQSWGEDDLADDAPTENQTAPQEEQKQPPPQETSPTPTEKETETDKDTDKDEDSHTDSLPAMPPMRRSL